MPNGISDKIREQVYNRNSVGRQTFGIMTKCSRFSGGSSGTILLLIECFNLFEIQDHLAAIYMP